MAFDFGSDILVDAMRAIDPARAAAAKQKLEQLSSQAKVAETGGTDFSSRLTRASQNPGINNEKAKAAEKFEAVVLTTFIQEMMPDNATKVYGEGLAGDMWKSQLAEKIAGQIAQKGGIGIAAQMLKDYQMKDDQKLPISGLSDPARTIEKTRAQDGAFQFLQKTELNALLSDREGQPAKLVIGTGAST